ncbi:MAG: penicillin acylase family protein [Bacteroidota bacterium]|nr:penicillin acylase family protein [Bacteroidota bacterium]
MSNFVKIAIGVGASILVILIAVAIFLYHLVTKSFPVTKGEIALQGLQTKVDIYRDEYGVPHIEARNEHDLMFAAGYVHAQDRLWQMDLTRRAGQGRLSEILDTATIKFDMLLRTLELAPVAETLYQYLHPNSRRLLADYAEGVNEFISTHKGKYPIEFDILNYDPEPWKPQHSLLLARLLAWELNFAWWVDLTYAEIATLVSPEKFQQILIGSTNFSDKQQRSIGVNEINNYLQLVRSYREYFNKGPFVSGSNAWVIDSSKSFSGKPILANDPHLLVSLPSKWYEVHLSAPGWNVAGVTIPGIPLVIVGHNDSIAWGFTNAMIDDADFFIEQIDSLKPNNYRFKNESRPMKVKECVIHVGKSDSVVIHTRSTHHGPIINDVHKKSIISMRWTGFDVSDEVLGFYRINRALNAVEFEEGLKQLTVPGQCAVYADVKGNIGCWFAGRIPIRGKHDGTLPLNGSNGEDEWRGFVSFEKLPKLWNPPDGIIISANQNISDKNISYYISNLWEPEERYNRILDLLSLEKISAQDCQQFQQDVVSYYCRDLTKHVLQAFESDSATEPILNEALVYLRNWDYRCTPSDIASTIINMFFIRLLHNLYEDELGKEVFHDFLYSLVIPYRVTSKLLQKDNSPWFDDVTTDTIETKGMIVRKSFIDAVNELKAAHGTEMKTWQWGKVHEVLFQHPLGSRQPLDKVFNIGPFSVGGSEQTIFKGAFQLNKPFNLFAGPSMRQIIDLAQPKSAYMIITLGQSGQPLHKHYDDQVSLWLNGGYRYVTIDWSKIKNMDLKHLILKPK